MTTPHPPDTATVPATRAQRRAQRRDPWHTRTLLAVLATCREHLIDTGTPPAPGRWGHHIHPRHAALTTAAAVAAVALAALTFWYVDPTSTHTTSTDPAIADLRTYEMALDGNDTARAARDKIADRFVITDTGTATVIGRRSTTTGQCWTLTVPKDATQPTTITRSRDTHCAPTGTPTPTGATSPSDPANTAPTAPATRR